MLDGMKECWVKRPGISVYLRLQGKCLDGFRLTPVLCLANVVVDADRRRQGLFRMFLAELEQAAHNHDRVVFVENVMHEGLRSFLEDKGYTRLRCPGGGSPHFYDRKG